MKIDPTANGPLSKARRLRSSGPGGALFARHLDRAGGAEPAVPPAAVGAAEAVLALQEWDATPGEDRREQARLRGNAMLDRLERIRLGLLTGRIDRATLEGLARSLRGGGGRTGDPRLDAIVADIELRAEVELAKLARAGGR